MMEGNSPEHKRQTCYSVASELSDNLLDMQEKLRIAIENSEGSGGPQVATHQLRYDTTQWEGKMWACLKIKGGAERKIAP